MLVLLNVLHVIHFLLELYKIINAYALMENMMMAHQYVNHAIKTAKHVKVNQHNVSLV